MSVGNIADAGAQQPPRLTKQGLASRLQKTTRTIERMMRAGTCPPYIRLPGSNRPLWDVPAVEAFERQHTHTSLAAELCAELKREGSEEK